ncbi:MAG TPA: polysaccharide biosynthesis tyrosine autokinase, partial [Gemmatimonadaceae bacterium]|nr:polysaccharide biosynthesis tyrosine autokinase [Gemmatimonadaceae bacterium]
MPDLVPYNNRKFDPLDLDAGPNNPSKASTEFVGVREYLAMVRRHWWVVLVVGALSVAYSANKAMKERPRYQASSTVRLVDARRAVAGDMVGRPGAEGGFGYQSDPIESQIQVLMSGAVASVAVDLKGLRLAPAPGNGWIEEIKDVRVSDSASASSLLLRFSGNGYTLISGSKQLPALYGVPAEVDGVRLTIEKKPYADSVRLNVLSRDAAIGYVQGGFSASSRPRTDILDLTYTGAERFEAKRIANAMAEAFKIHNASSSKDLSGRRRQFLENQLRQTDSMLSAAQATYSSFRSNRQVFSSTQAAGAEQANLINIDTRRAELQAERTTYQNLLNDARSSDGTSFRALRTIASTPGISGNPVVQQAYAQLEAYQRTRDSLTNTGAATTNPDVVAINSLIAPAADKMMDAVAAHINSLDAQIQALDRMRAAGATRITSAPAAESQELELQSQVQTIQQMSRQLQDELQRARMAEAVEGGQVEIVQLATSPGYQINTTKKKKVTTGAIIGLLLGCIVAILIDGLNSSVRKRSDVERLLGIPSLAVIPRLPSLNGSDSRVKKILPRLSNGDKNHKKSQDTDLVTVFNARSPAAESFRTLRTNLMFSQASQALRMIVVTSASPGEGKTTTASNLAVSFAQQGMRVLLVDCDLRRSRLHRLFQLKREPGFSDLVHGYADEEEVTHPTSVTGLYVICSGKLPPNPAEMLGSEEARKKFGSLMEGYDLVVLDTPPLLAASDAAILSTIANGVIVVLRAGSTENAAAQQSV